MRKRQQQPISPSRLNVLPFLRARTVVDDQRAEADQRAALVVEQMADLETCGGSGA